MRTLVLTLCCISIGLSQGPWKDRSVNLQVLPDSTDGQALRETMMEFTSALGVRCIYCHVGEEGKPLSTYSFAADLKPEKEIARGMLRMVRTINDDHLAKLFPNDAGRITVSCTTCHHGTTEPRQIQDIVWEIYQHEGAEKAIDQFRDLRKRYYGSFTYDFRELVLLRLATMCERDKRYDDAVKFLQLNAEYFPGSPHTQVSLASVYVEMKQTDKARAILNDVLKDHPDDERAKRVLEVITNNK
jgi:tetratricopeptide (TPR) repeat protein